MRKRRERLNADITPFIDVAFLLLIFFLVSSVLKKNEYALNLKLPETDSISRIKTEQEYYIELTPDEISYNGKILDYETIRKNLAMINDYSVPIYLRIDENVKYKKIMQIFDLLEMNELKNVMLVTKDE